MLPQQRRGLYLDRRIGQHQGAADGFEHATLRMLDIDDDASFGQGLVLDHLFDIQNRPAWYIDFVEQLHGLELGISLCPRLDDGKHMVQFVETGFGGGILRIVDQLAAPNQLGQRRPNLGLDDDVDIIIGASGPAFERPPGCPPPEALPVRGTASPKILIGYSGRGPRCRRC